MANTGKSSPSGPINSRKVTVTVAAGTINTITVTNIDVNVAGLRTTDIIVVNPTAALATGVGVAGARVKSAGVATISFVNPTAGNVVVGNVDFNVNIFRYSA